MAYFKINVCHLRVQEALKELHILVWDDLKGNNSWLRGNKSESYELFLEWRCHDRNFSLGGIHGELKGIPYRIGFTGISKAYFELVLPDRWYQFSSSSQFGCFSMPGSAGLLPGSACFSDRWSDEPQSEFLVRPFANWRRQCRTTWQMTTGAENEVVDFLADLISTVRQSRQRKRGGRS